MMCVVVAIASSFYVVFVRFWHNAGNVEQLLDGSMVCYTDKKYSIETKKLVMYVMMGTKQ